MGKWDNGVEQGVAAWSEKIFERGRGVVEWDGVNFKTNKFLNGL